MDGGSQIVKVSIWDDPRDGGRIPPWEQLTKNQEKWKETMQVGKGGGRGGGQIVMEVRCSRKQLGYKLRDKL